MATAKITKSAPLPPPPDTVTLVMSPAEARALLDVTRSIGGSPDTTRRGLTDAIGFALREAGVSHTPRADVSHTPRADAGRQGTLNFL